MQLNLTIEEAQILNEVLTSYLSDLRFEVANTDSGFFREGLKEREVFLKRIIEDLGKA
jgi:hypothetical protein